MNIAELADAIKSAITFTVNGADNEVIETYNGAFDTTEETTALSETEQQNKPSRKIIRDGQVLILRNGVTYDMMGNMLKF